MKTMSHYLKSISEQKNRLLEKGYDEDLMGAGEASGTAIELLQQTLFQTVLDTFLTDDPVTFTIPMTGRFDGDGDKVHFRFCYGYNPATTRLTLLKLTAQLRNQEITIPIINDNKRYLPTASKVYQLLTSKQRLPLPKVGQTPLVRAITPRR